MGGMSLSAGLIDSEALSDVLIVEEKSAATLEYIFK
jgi:hypothetical protein